MVFLKFLCDTGQVSEISLISFLFWCGVLPFVYIDRAFYEVSNHKIARSFLNYVVTYIINYDSFISNECFFFVVRTKINPLNVDTG